MLLVELVVVELVVVVVGGVAFTVAPGAEDTRKATALSESKPKIDTSGAKFNRVWRRKGRFWNRKGTNRHPRKK